MPSLRRALPAALLVLAACSRQAAEPPPAGAAPAAGTPGADRGAPAPSAAAGAYAIQATTLRRAPTEAARVPGPSGKELPNALEVLLRGERVTLLEAREEWARVRASDDREGWLRRGTLLEGDGVVEATVLTPADVFDRPDLLAANARRRVEPGTLLLVVKARPPFSEASVSGGPNAWVLTERLVTGEKEVSVAKLAEKARWLLRSGKAEDARRILALARQQFPGVPLVESLAAELGEAPAPATTAPPPSPPAPGPRP